MKSVLPVSLSLFMLAACSDTLPTTGRPAQDFRVSGSFRETVRLVHGGIVREQALPARPFSARAKGGAARTSIAPRAPGVPAGPGTLVMVSDARAGETPSTTRRTFQDIQGKTHELVAVRQGGRDLSLTHFVDGRRRAQIIRLWSHQDGAWVLRGARVVLFDEAGNGEVASLALSADDVRRVGANTAARGGASWLGRVAGALGPAPLHAQEPSDSLGFVPIGDPEEYYGCTGIKWRMAAYLAIGVAAAATGNLLATAAAMVGYWGQYDAGVEAGCF